MRTANTQLRSRAFTALAVLAVLALGFVPAAEAQQACSTGSRNFATVGGGGTTDKIYVLPGSSRGGVDGDVGTEIGRFWQSEDSTQGNNFLFGDADYRMDDTLCPVVGNGQVAGGWWQVSETTKRGINGFISGAGCLSSTCPFGRITVVVEDFGADGPPGVNDTAHFIGFQVDDTPGGVRHWDLSKVAPPNTDLLFIEFPTPTITSSFKQGTDRVVTLNYANIAFHVHGQTETAPIPATDIIASYDLLVHTGDTDPGRLRYADNCDAPNPGGRCWTPVQQTPFTGSGPSGVVAVVPCESVTKDSFVSLGVSFHGGAGPDIPSSLVGRAVQIECDPNLADPRQKPDSGQRYGDRPSRRTPSRSRSGR